MREQTPSSVSVSPAVSPAGGSVVSGGSAKLSVVVPVYNSAATIGMLADALVAANPGYDLQVVLVNDGSVDASAQVCREARAQAPRGRDLRRPRAQRGRAQRRHGRSRPRPGRLVRDHGRRLPEPAGGGLPPRRPRASREGRDIVFGAYAEKRHAWWRNLGSRLTNAVARRLMRPARGPLPLELQVPEPLRRRARALSYRGPFPYVDGLALRATRNIGVLETRHEPSRRARSQLHARPASRAWPSP